MDSLRAEVIRAPSVASKYVQMATSTHLAFRLMQYPLLALLCHIPFQWLQATSSRQPDSARCQAKRTTEGVNRYNSRVKFLITYVIVIDQVHSSGPRQGHLSCRTTQSCTRACIRKYNFSRVCDDTPFEDSRQLNSKLDQVLYGSSRAVLSTACQPFIHELTSR